MWIERELYDKIKKLMPIPTVDIVVFNEAGKILLLKRTCSPAKNKWWIPGGRIHRNETIIQAGMRELKEETGLSFGKYYQVAGIVENIFKEVHGITNVIVTEIKSGKIKLNHESSKYKWEYPHCLTTSESTHPYLNEAITKAFNTRLSKILKRG